MNYFWTNTIWYILLGLTTVFEVIYFMVKAGNRKLVFALYLTMAGMAFTFETTIYAFFKSYMYYPMIIKDFPIHDVQLAQLMAHFYDGLIGNLFSQFSVAATAVLIVVLNLKKYWYFIFAGIYGLIEELFKYLGVYEQHWYRTWMTVAGLLIFFWITEKIYNKARQGMGNVLKYITVFFGVFSVSMVLKDIPSYLFKLYHSLYILSDPINSDTMLFIIDNLLLFNIIMIAYYRRFKWQWNALVILFLAAGHYFAWKFDYWGVNCNTYLFFTFTAGSILGTYLFVFIVDRLYSQGKDKCIEY